MSIKYNARKIYSYAELSKYNYSIEKIQGRKNG